MGSTLFLRRLAKRRKNGSRISRPCTMPTSMPNKRDSDVLSVKMIYKQRRKPPPSPTFFYCLPPRKPGCRAWRLGLEWVQRHEQAHVHRHRLSGVCRVRGFRLAGCSVGLGTPDFEWSHLGKNGRFRGGEGALPESHRPRPVRAELVATRPARGTDGRSAACRPQPDTEPVHTGKTYPRRSSAVPSVHRVEERPGGAQAGRAISVDGRDGLLSGRQSKAERGNARVPG